MPDILIGGGENGGPTTGLLALKLMKSMNVEKTNLKEIL